MEDHRLSGVTVSETTIPADLTGLTLDQLRELEAQVTEEFDRLTADESPSVEALARATVLADTVDAIRADMTRRTDESRKATEQRDALKARMTVPMEVAPEAVAEVQPEATPEVPEVVVDTPEGEVTVPNSPEQLAELVAAASTAAVKAAMEHYTPATTRPATETARKLNPTLAEISARAPKIEAPRQESVIVASADIPGFTSGGRLADYRGIRQAMHNRARVMEDGRGSGSRVPIASLKRDHGVTLQPEYDPEKMAQVLDRVADPAALVAAGGWCAPSEIDYDFFNIVCIDGLLDLPTVGVNRGGIRWPISPSYADIVGNSGLWHWTETQDVAAVTGTAQSGTKTCTRVPCPTFLEARLACDGLCLTAGNLTNDAYPELTDNFLNLLQAGHAHKVNTLRIAQLVAASIAVSGTTGLGSGTSGVVAPVLNAIEMQAIDYRELYRMCTDAVLEVVLPRWLRGEMRADLRRRTGIDVEAFADAYLMSLFDAINVRIQWVSDWQVGGVGPSTFQFGGLTPITAWPNKVQFLLFAPGTFVLGRGLTLDLGIIRDSTLNATNDYTAAWMEECWLIAQRGHTSRLVTVNICPNGTTGAANYTACDL